MISRVWLHLTCFALSILASQALPAYLEALNAQADENLTISSLSTFDGVNRSHTKPETETLVLTSIVFRHGDRVPDVFSGYPNNPYQNVSFFPYNYGDLTLKGQKTLYEKGRELRKRYKTFLGDLYFNDLVDSTSSSYRRCQMSMQAMHTGLFGGLEDTPMKKLAWQAVPYAIIPPEQDNLLSVQLTCPVGIRNLQYPDDSQVDGETKFVFDVIDQYSGFVNASFGEALMIYDFIKTASEQGLPVPAEFSGIYPEPLRTVAMQDWGYFTQQTVGLIGPLVKRITDDAVAKASNTLQPAERKLFLYACHDMNVHYLLQALNVWKNEELTYGAYIIFELHNIQGTFGFKVFLQNDYVEPKLLDIPGCGTFCPISAFVALANELMALKQNIICK